MLADAWLSDTGNATNRPSTFCCVSTVDDVRGRRTYKVPVADVGLLVQEDHPLGPLDERGEGSTGRIISSEAGAIRLALELQEGVQQILAVVARVEDTAVLKERPIWVNAVRNGIVRELSVSLVPRRMYVMQARLTTTSPIARSKASSRIVTFWAYSAREILFCMTLIVYC